MGPPTVTQREEQLEEKFTDLEKSISAIVSKVVDRGVEAMHRALSEMVMKVDKAGEEEFQSRELRSNQVTQSSDTPTNTLAVDQLHKLGRVDKKINIAIENLTQLQVSKLAKSSPRMFEDSGEIVIHENEYGKLQAKSYNYHKNIINTTQMFDELPVKDVKLCLLEPVCVLKIIALEKKYFEDKIGFSSPAQSGIMDDLGLSLAHNSLFGSIMTIGTMLGAFMSGKLADLFGRRGAMEFSEIFCFLVGNIFVCLLTRLGIVQCLLHLLGLPFVPEAPIWLTKICREKDIESALKRLRGKNQERSSEYVEIIKYTGRAAKCMKTDLLMHEFCLLSLANSVPSKEKNIIPLNDAYEICRIFKKAYSNAHRALSHSWISSDLHEIMISSETINYPLVNGAQFSSDTTKSSLKPGPSNMTSFSTSNYSNYKCYFQMATSYPYLSSQTIDDTAAICNFDNNSLPFNLQSSMFKEFDNVGASDCLDYRSIKENDKNRLGLLLQTFPIFIAGPSTVEGDQSSRHGGIPWIVMSEIFPMISKSPAGSLVTVVNWFRTLVISYAFNFLMKWSWEGILSFHVFCCMRINNGFCGKVGSRNQGLDIGGNTSIRNFHLEDKVKLWAPGIVMNTTKSEHYTWQGHIRVKKSNQKL
ncbi:hypothetical protein AgCh_031056 [Apium graveolens]